MLFPGTVFAQAEEVRIGAPNSFRVFFSLNFQLTNLIGSAFKLDRPT